MQLMAFLPTSSLTNGPARTGAWRVLWLFSFLCVLQPVELHAVAVTPLPEGTTTITFSEDFVDVLSDGGIDIDPIGQTSVSGPPPAAEFPITGGFARRDAVLLKHRDSGLKFSTQPDIELFIRNFTIIGNDSGGGLFGQVFGVDKSKPFFFPCCVPIFDIDSDDTLSFTNVAAYGFAALFDLDSDVLRAIDVGTVNVQFIPIPPSVLLLGSALLGLGLLARQRAA